jgi:signal transduction histidine kinase
MSSLDEDQLRERLADLAVNGFADVCVVLTLDDEGKVSTGSISEARRSEPGAPHRTAVSASNRVPPAWMGAVLVQQKPMLLAQLDQTHLAALEYALDTQLDLARFSSGSLVAAPVMAYPHAVHAYGVTHGRDQLSPSQSTAVAVLVCVRLPSHRRYDSNDVLVVENLAGTCGAAVSTARLYAESKRAIRLRDEFISMAAHELRNPLTSLRGYAQLATAFLEKDTPDVAALVKSLRVIDRQSDKLARLVGHLLGVARIESGKLQLSRRSVDVVPLLRTLADETHATGRMVRLRAPEACELVVDPLLLEEVVQNLLDNAVKFSPDDGAIEVSLEQVGDSTVCIEVSDWGVGIPPDRRRNIFERFYQAHGEGRFGGLGLGLYISRQIVEAHGGSIRAECPGGGGTRIVVQLPTRVRFGGEHVEVLASVSMHRDLVVTTL